MHAAKGESSFAIISWKVFVLFKKCFGLIECVREAEQTRIVAIFWVFAVGLITAFIWLCALYLSAAYTCLVE